MNLLLDKTGEVQNTPLLGFRTVNVLGILAVVKLDFRQPGNIPTSVQLSLTAQQCRELSRQLLSQADVLELERPTPTQ